MDDETQWGQVWLLFGVGLAGAAQFAKLSLTFAALAALYDRSAPMLALSLTAVSGAGIVLGALAGFGVARYGPRKVLIGALILGGILSLLQSLVLPFPLFCLERRSRAKPPLGGRIRCLKLPRSLVLSFTLGG